MGAKPAHGHRIVRHRIKEDIVYFGVPAALVFLGGLVACAATGRYDGLVTALRGLILHPSRIATLSANNIIGYVMLFVGLSIAVIAAVTLRWFYASTLVIREDHELITHGLYRFTRHPIYFGVLIVCYSVPVFASSLLGFLIMTALIPLFLNRIRMEEKLPTDEFADAYHKYRGATKKLVPFVY